MLGDHAVALEDVISGWLREAMVRLCYCHSEFPDFLHDLVTEEFSNKFFVIVIKDVLEDFKTVVSESCVNFLIALFFETTSEAWVDKNDASPYKCGSIVLDCCVHLDVLLNLLVPLGDGPMVVALGKILDALEVVLQALSDSTQQRLVTLV